jgi:NADPH-dependent curcumin reductase CurA
VVTGNIFPSAPSDFQQVEQLSKARWRVQGLVVQPKQVDFPKRLSVELMQWCKRQKLPQQQQQRISR